MQKDAFAMELNKLIETVRLNLDELMETIVQVRVHQTNLTCIDYRYTCRKKSLSDYTCDELKVLYKNGRDGNGFSLFKEISREEPAVLLEFIERCSKE